MQNEIPFQLQIEFCIKDGSKLLKVYTVFKPLTSDKLLAESGKKLQLNHCRL
jgi:hypothetical protein